MMAAILAIFRKDLRHLWPHVVIFAGFLFIGAFADPVYSPFRQPTAAAIAWVASLFACWNLVITVVHQERLVGTHQSWRTCPYPKAALPAAKLLFILLCVNVPLLLMQAGVQAAVGIPVLHQASALLWRQLFISVFVLVPLVAIAVTTGSIAQALLTTLAVVLPFQLDKAFYDPGIPVPILIPEWAPAPSYWLRDAFRVLVCLAFGSAILYLQYFRRIPFISRLLLVAGLVLSILAPKLVPQSKQVALQYLLGRCPACGTVRANLDSIPRRQNLVRDPRDADLALALFAIPIRVEGFLDALDPFTPDKPAELWCDGRRVRAVVREFPPGQSWLALNTDRDPSFFARYAKRPVDLDGSVELILLARVASVSLRGRDSVAVPGVGACGLASAAGNMASLRCYTPAREAALAVELPDGGRQYLLDRSAIDDYSPTSFQFEPLQKVSGLLPISGVLNPNRLQLIAERPVSHIRARFHIHGIRLADFLLHF
jgi:hypothetical protein